MRAAAVSSHSIASETVVEASAQPLSAVIIEAPRGALMTGAAPLLLAASIVGAALWALLSWAMA
jgi:hypothetical protein